MLFLGLLTNLRFLGFCSNPVSFYFCYPEGNQSPAGLKLTASRSWLANMDQDRHEIRAVFNNTYGKKNRHEFW